MFFSFFPLIESVNCNAMYWLVWRLFWANQTSTSSKPPSFPFKFCHRIENRKYLITILIQTVRNCKRLPSHTGQEQACSRITWLFCWLFFVNMPKMAEFTDKLPSTPQLSLLQPTTAQVSLVKTSSVQYSPVQPSTAHHSPEQPSTVQ